MALMLGAEALEGVIHMREAIDLLEGMSEHEAAGKTFVSPRLNSTFDGGWMRMMFAADYAAGFAATKAFHMIKRTGVRYVVSLYRLADGELVAVLDGRLITDLRTGAASGVVARKVKIDGPVSVGLIGAGHQSRMQLESLASVYRVESASVFSPTPENRERLARQMSSKLGIKVKAVESAAEATRGHKVVVAATSSQSSEPVLRGEWLDRCRLLCAVGSTRPQSIEVDERSFANAAIVVVDTPRAAEEAGDLQQAVKSGAVTPERQVTLAQVAGGAVRLPESGLVAFKSVGTALQDLALAVRFYELLRTRKDLPSALDLASLKKPVSAKPK
ncbi:MAG TPA: ornithine cyclodeaminase family protein [Burkholderiales bacterium]|jgi:alanine dehydrogenase|nr:ornithine cyclodeaminase family protein [Burkholderiales bacterium]